MNRTICLKVIVAFILMANSSAWAVSAAKQPDINQDACVYILNMGIEANAGSTLTFCGVRNGFAVGNGQYILTAAHCVDDFENTNQSLKQPLVLSPYYGDVFEAEIVAVDKETDIAVLKPTWKAHPALELATRQQWEKSKTIALAGYPPMSRERGGSGDRFSRNIRFETVPRVNASGAPMFIGAGPVKYAGQGWSGSPMIVRNSGKVAGIVCTKSPETRFLKIKVFLEFKIPLSKNNYIAGCSSIAIRDLFVKSSLPFEGPPPACPDISRRAEFEKILSVLDVLKPDNKDQIRTAFENVCREMPDSYFALIVHELILRSFNGQAFLEKDVETSQSAFVHAVYGNILLVQNKPKEAAAQFEWVTEQDPNHVFACHGRLAALVKADPNGAEMLGRELVQRWPQNAGFWFEYSRALRANNKRREELPIIQNAVELSETVPYLYQRYLADSLAANEKYDQAEQAYEELLKTHQCENCWLAYSDLLLKMGPDKAQQAKEAIAKAKPFNKDPNSLPGKYSEYEHALEKVLSDPNTAQEN